MSCTAVRLPVKPEVLLVPVKEGEVPLIGVLCEDVKEEPFLDARCLF